jgi:hypothetical protein
VFEVDDSLVGCLGIRLAAGGLASCSELSDARSLRMARSSYCADILPTRHCHET